MDPFVSELRKINTDGLIFEFSKLSIEMFKNDEAMRGIDFPIKHFGVVKSARVGLSAWDIPLIEKPATIGGWGKADARLGFQAPARRQLCPRETARTAGRCACTGGG